jgi:hypothetical protein
MPAPAVHDLTENCISPESENHKMLQSRNSKQVPTLIAIPWRLEDSSTQSKTPIFTISGSNESARLTDSALSGGEKVDVS